MKKVRDNKLDLYFGETLKLKTKHRAFNLCFPVIQAGLPSEVCQVSCSFKFLFVNFWNNNPHMALAYFLSLDN